MTDEIRLYPLKTCQSTIMTQFLLTSMTSNITLPGQDTTKVDCSVNLHCKLDGDWGHMLTRNTLQGSVPGTGFTDKAGNKEDAHVPFYPEQGWMDQVARRCSEMFYKVPDPNRPSMCPIYWAGHGDWVSHSNLGYLTINGSFSHGGRVPLHFWPRLTVMGPPGAYQGVADDQSLMLS